MWWMKQWQPSNWSLSSTKVTPWQFYFVSYCEFLVFGWSKLWTGALDQGFFAHWVGFDLCEGDLEPTGLSVGSFCLAYYFLRTTCVQWSWHFWGSLITVPDPNLQMAVRTCKSVDTLQIKTISSNFSSFVPFLAGISDSGGIKWGVASYLVCYQSICKFGRPFAFSGREQ